MCERFTTTHAACIPASAKRSRNSAASSSFAVSGVVTTTNAHAGSCRRARTRSERSLKSPNIPSNDARNCAVSARTSAPNSFPTVLANAVAPNLATDSVNRPARADGQSNQRRRRPPKKSVSCFGASRNESALLVGGVSITIRSWSSSSANSYSFSMAMYSCVPVSVSAMRR